MATAGYLKFRIGELTCAVQITRVREIVPMVDLIRPPRQPRVLEGYLNLGGTAVPALRVDRLLNLNDRPVTDADHLILVSHADRTVALLVERALDIAWVADERLVTSAYARLNPCVSAEIEGGSTHVIDLDRLLADVERRSLDEFAMDAQKRIAQLRGDAA